MDLNGAINLLELFLSHNFFVTQSSGTFKYLMKIRVIDV